ncbi:hypothetical protein D1007_35609 [Hordeum vulgare]|nr:hypothetical protein D1007_35609 [Hordeum vulgare]
MAELRKKDEDAWKWLSKIPKETWSRHAMDYTCKTDLVVNNLSEVFNKMILDIRCKPIRNYADGFRTKLMTEYQSIKEKIESSRWKITPTYMENLEESKKYSRHCTAYMAGPGIWQATSGEETYYVNLEKWTCDCKKWDLTIVPCNHAVCATTRLKLQREDFVHDFFKKPLYKETYKHIVYPLPGPEFWPRTPTQDMDPPVFKEKKGRKQTVRRKGQFEVPSPTDTSRMAIITCSNHNGQKHRYTYCTMPLKPHLQARKNKHKTTKTVYHDAGGGSSSANVQSAEPPTSTSTKRARTAGDSSTTTSQAANKVVDSTSAPSRRGGRPYTPPRPATASIVSVGGRGGSKRKRFQNTRMRGYFYASGNY